jgi:hypothetical protein
MRRAARLVLPGLSALLCAAILTGTQSARASDDDKKKPQYGMFNVGFHVEAGAGVYQVLGQGGMVPGIYPRVAVEMHLGPHFSIPVVGRLQTSVEQGVPDFAQLSVAPGLNFRLRELEWPVAIVFGVGARIGKFTASRELVDFEQTNDPGAQEVAGFPVAPEATVKIEWWIASPFALKAGVTYAPVFVQGVPIHNIEESIAAALVF